MGSMVHAYNATRHGSTGQAPYFLMFGRQSRLLIDLSFDLLEKGQTYGKYVAGLHDCLKAAYDLASREAEKSREKQKGTNDHRAWAAVLNPGNRVLVHIVAHDGEHQLADKWENHVYIVAEHPNVDIPVYVVKRENGSGGARKLHRNHLLPANHLPIQVLKQPCKLHLCRQQRC